MTSKRILSCILAAAMAVSTFPVITANADTPTTISSNTGETKSGNLTITLNIPFKDATASDFTFTEPTSLEYSGSNKTATVTSSKTGMGAITVGYYSDENCTTTAVPKNVGTYYVGITLAEGANYNASSSVIHDSSWTFEITKANPNAPAAPTLASSTKNSITLTAVTDCEYSIDGTNYQDSPEFTGLTPGMEYTFYQRIKASDNTEQSAASESAAIRTAPDTYGLTITLTIGVDDKTASNKAYANTETTLNLSDLIVNDYTPGAVSIVEDTNSILNSTPTFDSDTKKLTYKFKANAAANKTAKVRIPLTNSDQTDSYNIDVTLTVLSAPQQETGSDTVIWDAPSGTAETGSSSSNASDQIKVKSDSGSAVPTVNIDAGTITLSSEGTLTINETGSGNNVNADCTINNVAGGTITVDTKTDDLSTITAEGTGTHIKLGSFVETLSAGDKMTISSDGKYGKFEDNSTNKTIFVNADSDATVEMPKTLTTTQNDETIKAMEVKEDIGDRAVNTIKGNLTSPADQKKIAGGQGISAKVVTIENGERKELEHSTFNDQITIIIPFSAFFQNVRFLLDKFHLYYVNATALDEITGNDFVVDNTANKRKASLKSNHCSDWVLTNDTKFNVVINAGQHGAVTADNDPAEYKYGEEVTLTVTPESGYRLSSLSYTGAVSGTVTITGNKFKMPVGDVTITAAFTKNGGGGSYIDYTYKTIDGVGYRIHPSYVGVYEGDKDIEDMVIKSEIEGKTVTTIEAGAFNSFKKMKSITLPDTLTTIEQGAFWGCAALEEIDIPETVTKIESNAFAYCSNLKKLIVRNKDCSIAMYNNTLYNDYKSSKYVYDGVIVGYVGSPAEKFANKFKYTFEDIEKIVVTTTTTEETTTTTTITTTTTVSTGVSTTATSGTTTPVTTLKIGVVNDPKIDNGGKITWSKAENAVQYCVAKIVGGKKFYGATVEENSYTLNSVPNEDYKLYVIAMGEDGRYTTGKVLDVKVAKPVGKSAAPTVDKDGNVTWKAVKNAVKYKAVKIVNGVYYGGAEVTKTSYKLDSVPANDYQVYILSYGENGAYTVGEKTTVKVDDPIGFVNDVKVDNSGKVSWSKATKAVEYRVVKMMGDKKYYGSITPRTYYHFDSIPNEDYKLYVIAMGADGRYTTGKVLSIKVNAVGKAAAPTVAKDGTVSWKAVANAVKYKVVKKINGSYYGGSEVTETSYKLNNLPVNDYQIYVLSYGENGAYTVGEKTTVKVDKPLGFVNDVKVDKNGKVTWSKAQNATSYCVVKVFNGKKYYGGETKTTSYQFESPCYKDYQVYVIAYGANKNYTVGKRVTVEVGDLGVVFDTTVDKNGKVSWSAVRGAVKYKVYKIVDGKKYYGITEGTSYTFKNVPTTDYSVYVVAFDKDGKYRIGTTKAVAVAK